MNGNSPTIKNGGRTYCTLGRPGYYKFGKKGSPSILVPPTPTTITNPSTGEVKVYQKNGSRKRGY